MPGPNPSRYIDLTDKQLIRRWRDLLGHALDHLATLKRLEETIARTEQCALDAEAEMQRRGIPKPVTK